MRPIPLDGAGERVSIHNLRFTNLRTLLYSRILPLFFIALSIVLGCANPNPITPGLTPEPDPDPDILLNPDSLVLNYEDGCGGMDYPARDETPYVLPYPVGETHATGLCNCSSSFHSADRNDNLAYDFDMPEGSVFTAIRAGSVIKVVEDQNDFGGDGAGNYLVVNHRDGSYGLYYHSPRNGILVEEGDEVSQGQELGIVGRSGYAGYPHLHLIVTWRNYRWPYTGVPITFSNNRPRHLILKSGYRSGYEAEAY